MITTDSEDYVTLKIKQNIKNLKNNKELYNYIEDIIIMEVHKSFNKDSLLIDLAYM